MSRLGFFILALACSYCSFTVETPRPAAYRIKIEDKWAELSEITSRAIAHIKKQTPTFQEDDFRCNFWIDPESKDKLISITFTKGIGQMGYRIYFSRDGKITGTWSGIMQG